MSNQNQSHAQAVAVQGKGECTYMVAGNEVKLNYEIVKISWFVATKKGDQHRPCAIHFDLQIQSIKSVP